MQEEKTRKLVRRKNKLFLLFAFLIILRSNFGSANSVTAAATFEVENTLPVVRLSLYGDEGFTQEISGLSSGDTGYLKIEAIDNNGYRDVDGVKVKITGINNSSEVIIRDYSNATFLNGVAGIATYFYEINGLAEYSTLRVYCMAVDDGKEVIGSIDVGRVNNNLVTGAVVAETNRSEVLEFFKSLFARLLSIF